MRRQVVSFPALLERHGTNHVRETGAFLFTTAELTITLQLCCHRLPGFLSSVLVMLPWPQPQEFLSRVWGCFGLGSQACLMKQFALHRGSFRKPVHKSLCGRMRGLCKEGEGREQVGDSSPSHHRACWAAPPLSCLETDLHGRGLLSSPYRSVQRPPAPGRKQVPRGRSLG